MSYSFTKNVPMTTFTTEDRMKAEEELRLLVSKTLNSTQSKENHRSQNSSLHQKGNETPINVINQIPSDYQ